MPKLPLGNVHIQWHNRYIKYHYSALYKYVVLLRQRDRQLCRASHTIFNRTAARHSRSTYWANCNTRELFDNQRRLSVVNGQLVGRHRALYNCLVLRHQPRLRL